MSLLSIILILLAVIVGAYVINRMLEIPEPLKMIFNVLIGIAVLFIILSIAGFGNLTEIRVGQPIHGAADFMASHRTIG